MKYMESYLTDCAIHVALFLRFALRTALAGCIDDVITSAVQRWTGDRETNCRTSLNKKQCSNYLDSRDEI